MTTITNFVTALGDVTIAGVTSKLNEPPRKLTTADLPAQWVQVPNLAREPATFQSQGKLWDTHRAQLIVAFEPVGQNTQAANWAGVLTLMDSVWTAIAAASLVQGRLQYTIAQGIVTVAEAAYWAVIVEVEAHG